MTGTERRLLDIANVLVGGTGLVYAAMKYLMDPRDEWAVVNHPWQPHVQHIHVVVTPFLIFLVGLLWKDHVSEKLRNNGSRGRATGLSLAFQLLPMVLSGYLVQISVSESWRTVWIWIHIITGALWCLSVVAHRLRRTNGPSG